MKGKDWSLFFVLTLILLGPIELLGHAPLVGIAVLLILRGSGGSFRHPRALSVPEEPAGRGRRPACYCSHSARMASTWVPPFRFPVFGWPSATGLPKRMISPAKRRAGQGMRGSRISTVRVRRVPSPVASNVARSRAQESGPKR